LRNNSVICGIVKRFRESREISQPVPNVREDDVVRVVRRDFAAEQFESAVSVLGRYGTERWEKEHFRVRIAALKLANGSLDKLQHIIEMQSAIIET
jgi:hypothetical protein